MSQDHGPEAHIPGAPGDSLGRWMNLYDQLVEARALLKAAEQSPGGVVPDELKDEVRRLQRLASVALTSVANEQKIQRDMSACMQGRDRKVPYAK